MAADEGEGAGVWILESQFYGVGGTMAEGRSNVAFDFSGGNGGEWRGHEL